MIKNYSYDISRPVYNNSITSHMPNLKKDLKHALIKNIITVKNSPNAAVSPFKSEVSTVAQAANDPNKDKFSVKELKYFTYKLLHAAEKAIGKTETTDNKKKQQAFNELSELKDKMNSYFNYMLDNDPVDKNDINKIVKLKKNIINTIAENIASNKNLTVKQASPLASSLIRSALSDINNDEPWQQITKKFEHGGKVFISQLTPAGQMKLGDDDVFPVSYNNRGISGASSERTDHATNLWISDFKVAQGDGEKSIFKGIRHGILSPYSLPFESHERTEGAKNRAKELVTAALYLQPEKMEAALNGKTVDVKLASLSLVTPIKIPGETSSEKDMLVDQYNALKHLNDSEVVQLKIINPEGKLQSVKVKVSVAAFNIGVNNLAVGWTNAGKTISDTYNTEALTRLAGRIEDHEPGGWVGDYLAAGPHKMKI